MHEALFFGCDNLFKSLNKKVAYVSQEPYIYNDSFEKNIFLGREVIEEDRARVKSLIQYFELDILEKKSENIFDPTSGLGNANNSRGHYPQCLVSTAYDDFRRIPIVRSITTYNPT